MLVPVLSIGLAGCLPPAQIYSYARHAGFPEGLADQMTSIALRESRGCPAVHTRNSREDSYGLWQINVKAHPGLAGSLGIDPDDLLDPEVNARAAASLWAGNPHNLQTLWLLNRYPHPVIRGLGLGVAQVLPAPVVQTIASTIQTQEGYYPGSLAYTNNNPGNLVYAGQPGATQGQNGFAVFDSYSDGMQALQNQIQLYAGRGMTIDQMMATYAPASQPGNNPSAYAQTIANALGVPPDTQLLSLTSDSASADSGTSDSTDAQASAFDPTPLIAAGIVMGLALVALR